MGWVPTPGIRRCQPASARAGDRTGRSQVRRKKATARPAASAEKPTADATEPFVANADVNIQDSSGREVLKIRTEGPLLLVKLPSGRYTVDAQWNGVRKRHSVAVSDEKRQHVMFDFAGADRIGN